MPIKIIKRGSLESARIQSLPLAGTPSATEPANDETHLPWRDGVEAARPGAREGAIEPGPSAADLALIEKNAYESGFQQGERTGMEMAERKLEVVLRRYEAAIEELGRVKPLLYTQVEREVVKLSLEIARKIVQREIHADPAILQTLVKVALGHLAEKSSVTIHLHPVDYNYLLEHRSDLFSDSVDRQEIVLLADKTIERGGCLIKTDCGDIDARIEEKFREVERGFFEGLQ